ncbi:MAG: glucosylceramidase [Cytophagia bacterium]|nr:glucosylceramidase [Cytophagia bacterium]
MKISFYGQVLAATLGLALFACQQKSKEVTIKTENVEQWMTTGDKEKLLAKVAIAEVTADTTALPKIIINEAQQYQSIDGFGYSLTGGSAYLLHTKLDTNARTALLKELFLTNDQNIGVSYLRISIGASDLDDHVFSYNDLPAGKTDKALKNFSLAEDEKHLIPILKEIIQLAPDIKIMGSPWSAPAWMKDNQHAKGGKLSPEYYGAYADYFVKYIKGMAEHGIKIDAVTIQNEPENPKNKPSMVMTAEDQATFVKLHLGPAFEKANIKTKIIVFDHNCDHPEYPISILNDADAKKYIDGSAFHLYLGEIKALSKVHNAHPDKHVYFTEQWTSPEGTFNGDLAWHARELIIGATRNWSRNVLEWNLAADPQFNPHTDDGGCTMCQGALTIGDSITRNVSYYIIAQASKFVRPGSVRVASTIPDSLHNVAFVTPQGKTVLIVLNEATVEKKFMIKSKNRNIPAVIPAGAVVTYSWE